MGQGTQVAGEDNPEHARLIDDMKDQLLIVFLKRLGGKLKIPVSEVDNTGQDLFVFRYDRERRAFDFEIRRKH